MINLITDRLSPAGQIKREYPMAKSKPQKLTLTSPAKYRIYIQGYLDNIWADQLGEITQ